MIFQDYTLEELEATLEDLQKTKVEAEAELARVLSPDYDPQTSYEGEEEKKSAIELDIRCERENLASVEKDIRIVTARIEAATKKERPIPDDLEHIGMGLPCAECGEPTSWLPCWNCGGEGGWDGDTLMEEDPLWYNPDDYRSCGECKRAGGHPYCLGCRKVVKVEEPDTE